MGYEGSWKKPSSFHAEPFTRALIYSIHGRQDLPAADLEHTTLFQLFGRISPAADYVLTERDQLEFMRMLQRHDKRPHHLFDLMRGRHLLLLGCGFSDWLARFFLELVTNIWAPGKRLAKTLVDAAQAGDPGLVFFLGECGVEVCKDVSAADFAIELSRRWLERHPDGQPTGRAVIAWDGAQEDAEGEAPVSRVYDKNRVMFYTFLYSRWGEDNVWCGRFLTPEGYPSVSGQCAAEYVEKTWDAQGNLIQERYLDGTGMPAPAIPGYFGGRWRWDANGNELEHVYLDDQGRPTATGDGIASVRFQRDEKGRSIRTTYTDCLGRPCCHGGVGAIESEYDRYGRTIRSSYFDFQGRPAARIDNGIQTMKWEHDDHGNEVSAACFDKDGQPTMETNDRFHMIRKVYNERDQVVRQAFFDTQGRPALNKRLYHGQNITPDERNKPLRIQFFDVGGKPTVGLDGYGEIRQRFDQWGDSVEVAYFDAAGNPINIQQSTSKESDSNYHKVILEFAAKGQVTSRSYWGADGKPVQCNDQFHLLKATYDRRGNNTEQIYYDTQGKPVRESSRGITAFALTRTATALSRGRR